MQELATRSAVRGGVFQDLLEFELALIAGAGAVILSSVGTKHFARKPGGKEQTCCQHCKHHDTSSECVPVEIRARVTTGSERVGQWSDEQVG